MAARGCDITIKEGEQAPCHVSLTKQPVFVAQVDWNKDFDVRRAAAESFEAGQSWGQPVMVVQGYRRGQPAGAAADSREVSEAHSPTPHNGRLKCSKMHRGEWEAIREGSEAYLEGATT